MRPAPRIFAISPSSATPRPAKPCSPRPCSPAPARSAAWAASPRAPPSRITTRAKSSGRFPRRPRCCTRSGSAKSSTSSIRRAISISSARRSPRCAFRISRWWWCTRSTASASAPSACGMRATDAGIPKVIVINALDKPNADFEEVLADARAHFGPRVFPLNVPVNPGPGFSQVLDVLRSDLVTYETTGRGKFTEEPAQGAAERARDAVAPRVDRADRRVRRHAAGEVFRRGRLVGRGAARGDSRRGAAPAFHPALLRLRRDRYRGRAAARFHREVRLLARRSPGSDGARGRRMRR